MLQGFAFHDEHIVGSQFPVPRAVCIRNKGLPHQGDDDELTPRFSRELNRPTFVVCARMGGDECRIGENFQAVPIASNHRGFGDGSLSQAWMRGTAVTAVFDPRADADTPAPRVTTVPRVR